MQNKLVMKNVIIVALVFLCQFSLKAQEIILDKKASLEQVFIDSFESENLLPMNELDIESGYVLYQSKINALSDNCELELENIRDYAVVYVDGKFQGTITNNRKKLDLKTSKGEHQLQLYVENIGRITYGPEILDNSKGLFGAITLDGEDILNWTMTTLNIRNYSVEKLTFELDSNSEIPCFHKGRFIVDQLQNCYLDISGWGMGEVWINHKYMGAYWDQEKQQSIQIQSDDLHQGENEIVVFELKNNSQNKMKLVNKPIFK